MIILGICGVVIAIECATTLIVGNMILKIKCKMMSLFGYLTEPQIHSIIKCVSEIKIYSIIYSADFIERMILGKRENLQAQHKVQEKPDEKNKMTELNKTNNNTTDVKESIDAIAPDTNANQSVEALQELSTKKLISQLSIPEYMND